MTPVTDPDILKQLNGDSGDALSPVTDPAILAQLNGAPAATSETAERFGTNDPSQTNPPIGTPGFSIAQRLANAFSGMMGDAGNAGRGLAEGVPANIAGAPGDVEALGRIGYNAMAPLTTPAGIPTPSVSPQPIMPTSSALADQFFGPVQSQEQAAGRLLSGVALPPMISVAMRLPGAIGGTVARTMGAATADPEVAALAQRAMQMGIPIRPGQASASRAIKTADDQLSTLPPILTGASETNPLKITPDAQHEAFTRAITKTMGEDSPTLTQGVMAKIKAKIGAIYDAVLPRNNITLDQSVLDRLAKIQTDAEDALGDGAKPIKDALNHIADRTDKNGVLAGNRYQAMRATGGRLSAVSNSQDPTVAHYGDEIRSALDDAFQAQAQGDDGALMSQARQWYRNFKVVQPLAEKAPTGKISPALLLGQVVKAYPKYASEGAGDIGDLAKIGQQFLKAPPDSGTATRSAVMNALTHPIRTAVTAAASPAVAAIGRTMNSAINSPVNAAGIFGTPTESARSLNAIMSDPRLVSMMSPNVLSKLLLAQSIQPSN